MWCSGKSPDRVSSGDLYVVTVLESVRLSKDPLLAFGHDFCLTAAAVDFLSGDPIF